MELTQRHSDRGRKTFLVAAIAVVLAVMAGLALLNLGAPAPLNRQDEVAARGAQVMPFNLEQTRHIFEKLDDGGLQRVVVKDPANKEQIPLIRSHLDEESEKFRRGDFSDPAKIHGQDMPGLAELKAAAWKIDVLYTPLPDEAQIRYTTKDPALVTAIHQWFDAQLSDHGRHASGH